MSQIRIFRLVFLFCFIFLNLFCLKFLVLILKVQKMTCCHFSAPYFSEIRDQFTRLNMNRLKILWISVGSEKCIIPLEKVKGSKKCHNFENWRINLFWNYFVTHMSNRPWGIWISWSWDSKIYHLDSMSQIVLKNS